MRFFALLVGMLLLLQNSVRAAEISDDLSARIQKMEAEIAQLKSEQAALKAKAAQNTAQSNTLTVPSNIEMGKKLLTITSADKKYQLALHGTAHFDNRQFMNNNIAKDEFIVRRLRPIVEAKVGDASFRLMPDFAGSTTKVMDAHADYKLTDSIKFRFGKFKTPVSLERLQSPADMFFIERGMPSNLAPNRDIGVMIYGDILPKQLEYQLGVFNGNADLANSDGDDDNKKDIAARLFAYPFQTSALKGFGIGVGGSVGERAGSKTKTILGTYKTPGQQDFFIYRSDVYADGQQWRLYPQANYYYKNIGLLAEYAISNQEVTRGSNHLELQNNAWQVAGSYVLTGEDVNFKGGVTPSEEFNFKRLDLYSGEGIGAWEITARIGQTNIDDQAFINFADSSLAASQAQTFGGGLNWYLNENFKLMADYNFTSFDGGAIGGADRPDEQAFFTRTQFRF